MTDTVGSLLGNYADIRSYVTDDSWVLPSCFIGLEYELEKCRLDDMKYWRADTDGSLRGPDAFEYILNLPLCGADLTSALHELEERVATLDQHPRCNERTSVHVHLDVRDLSPEELVLFAATYISVEPLLFNYVSRDRSESNFCLPYSKMSDGLSSLMTMAQASRLLDEQVASKLMQACDQMHKYASLNFKVVRQFGSAEFRHHQGEWRAEPIAQWINICMCIKKFATTANLSAGDLPKYVSCNGIEEYCKEIFGDYLDLLTYPGYNAEVFKCLRVAQPIVAATIDEEYSLIRSKLQLKIGTNTPDEALLARFKARVNTDSDLAHYYDHSREGCIQSTELYFEKFNSEEVKYNTLYYKKRAAKALGK